MRQVATLRGIRLPRFWFRYVDDVFIAYVGCEEGFAAFFQLCTECLQSSSRGHFLHTYQQMFSASGSSPAEPAEVMAATMAAVSSKELATTKTANAKATFSQHVYGNAFERQMT
mgnify:CR=1 FL=1